MEITTRPIRLYLHSLKVKETTVGSKGELTSMLDDEASDVLRIHDSKGRFTGNTGRSGRIISVNYAAKPEVDNITFFEDMRNQRTALSFRNYVLSGKPKIIIERKTYSFD